MKELPEKSSQVSHVLLDGALLWRDGKPEEGNLAVSRISDIGAVAISVDQTGPEIKIDVDVSSMIVGALAVIDSMTERLSGSLGVSREEVIATTRERVDEYFAFWTGNPD